MDEERQIRWEDVREEGEEEEWVPGDHPFWPTHVIDQLILFYSLVGILLTLAILFPFKLDEPADPLNTPVGIKPEWYFLPVYQVLKYFPKSVGISLVILFVVVMFFWPLIDTWIVRRWRALWVGKAVGWTIFVLVVLMGFLGWLSERTFTLGSTRIHFDLKAVPHLLPPGAEEPARGE